MEEKDITSVKRENEKWMSKCSTANSLSCLPVRFKWIYLFSFSFLLQKHNKKVNLIDLCSTKKTLSE